MDEQGDDEDSDGNPKQKVPYEREEFNMQEFNLEFDVENPPIEIPEEVVDYIDNDFDLPEKAPEAAKDEA